MSADTVSACPGGVAPAVGAVLVAAARVVAARSAAPLDVDVVLAHGDGQENLLALLAASPGLRAAAGAGAGSAAAHGEGSELAAALCAADPQVAAPAVETVRRQLADHRRAARTQAARQRRAARTEDRPAPQRAQAREQRRVEELRQARDAARGQARTAQAEAATLRAELAALTEDLAAVQAQVLTEQARLRAARAELAAVPTLAANLAEALSPPPEPAEPSGPGEPVADLLARCAAAAAVPAPAREHLADWLPGLLRTLADPPRPPVRTNELAPVVQVLGAGAEVGGSCVLVTAGGTRVLVDAGMRPGATDPAPPGIRAALADRLDAVVITHAHNDHAGWVPAVLAAQPGVPVFATAATQALLGTMWFDSAKVMARRGADGAAPPAYGRPEVVAALEALVPLRFGQSRRVGQLELELFQAGHIVGAAGVVLRAGEQRVVVSGDVSRPGQKSVGGILVPEAARGADLLLLESTYGASTRMPPRAASVAQFVRDVSGVLERGGRVLVPSFALGRAQEVALVLAEHLPEADVLIDGLARDVSAVYEEQAGPDGAPLSIFGGRVRPVPIGGTPAAIARLRTGVVIATSGMLAAGPAVSWARALLPDPQAGLMVVGYQDEESPGARLLELAAAGGGLFELPTQAGGFEDVVVAASVAQYGLGAHANQDELAAIATEVDAAAVMLVHGEPRAQESLAARLRLRQQAVVGSAGALRL